MYSLPEDTDSTCAHSTAIESLLTAIKVVRQLAQLFLRHGGKIEVEFEITRLPTVSVLDCARIAPCRARVRFGERLSYSIARSEECRDLLVVARVGARG